jgi:hypothetical protein
MAQLMSRLPSVRKAALITFVASVLANGSQAWNLAQRLAATTSSNPVSKKWIIPLIPLLCFYVAIMPLFYFALYRYEGTLRVPKRLQLLSFVAAFVFAMTVAAEVPDWIQSLGPFWTMLKAIDWRTGATSILIAAGDPSVIGLVFILVAVFSAVTYTLLLIALSRQTTDELSAYVPASRLVSRVTTVAFIAGGISVIIVVGRVILTPYGYFQIRDYVYRNGGTPPHLSDMMLSIIRTLLDQACILAAPYIVCRVLLEADQQLNDAHPDVSELA